MTFVLSFFEIIITFIDPERAGVVLCTFFFLVIVIELFSESLLIFSFLILLLVGPKSYEHTHTHYEKNTQERKREVIMFSLLLARLSAAESNLFVDWSFLRIAMQIHA